MESKENDQGAEEANFSKLADGGANIHPKSLAYDRVFSRRTRFAWNEKPLWLLVSVKSWIEVDSCKGSDSLIDGYEEN